MTPVEPALRECPCACHKPVSGRPRHLNAGCPQTTSILRIAKAAREAALKDVEAALQDCTHIEDALAIIVGMKETP